MIKVFIFILVFIHLINLKILVKNVKNICYALNFKNLFLYYSDNKMNLKKQRKSFYIKFMINLIFDQFKWDYE